MKSQNNFSALKKNPVVLTQLQAPLASPDVCSRVLCFVFVVFFPDRCEIHQKLPAFEKDEKDQFANNVLSATNVVDFCVWLFPIRSWNST